MNINLRYYSHQWRGWATCYIQAAWRRHRKRKHAKRWEEANNRLQDALATGSETPTLSFGASIYASKFSSNASRIVRRKRRNRKFISPESTSTLELMLQKPTHLNFDDDASR